MTLPASLAAALERLLGAPPQQVRPVGGGDISQAARFEAGSGTFLVKWHARPPRPEPGWPGMFEAEARGLALLASTETLRAPAVHGFGEPAENAPAHIVMDWIERGNDSQRAGAALGEGLAALHRHTAARYGLNHNNYCGATPQDNTSCESWIDEAACRPSLLHGDLWGGNWLVADDGEPVLIDPAVYYGDREAELAMCRLFGGFPQEFYRAYDAAWPPAPGSDDRIQLYQMYHVLNHLNLFGEGYGSHVDAILRRYVG